MNKCTLFTLIIFLIVSCTRDQGTTDQQNPEEQTPEVLNDERNLDISSFSKRYGTDIIQELFDEAVENNKDLKTVTSTLEQLEVHKSDSLEAYRTYKRNNQNYWNALTKYSNQLSDSTMKKDLLKIVGTLKAMQSKRTSTLDKLVADIDSVERSLCDLKILMKIIVTEPMMNNYQRNELPNIQTLESLKKAMDSSVNEIEPYTKIQK